MTVSGRETADRTRTTGLLGLHSCGFPPYHPSERSRGPYSRVEVQRRTGMRLFACLAAAAIAIAACGGGATTAASPSPTLMPTTAPTVAPTPTPTPAPTSACTFNTAHKAST